MTIKNSQVDGLIQVLSRLGTQTSPKLVYFVAMNLRRLQSCVAALNEARKPNKDYAEYEQRCDTLCASYADRDLQTCKPSRRQVPVPGGGTATVYDIVERREEFDVARAALDAASEEVCQARMQQEVEVFSLMQEEVDADLVTIRMSECPKGVITGDVAAVLMEAGILEWDIEKPGENTEV